MRLACVLLIICWFGLPPTARAQSTVPTVGRAIPVQTLAPGGAPLEVELSQYFTLPGVSGPIVQFDTVLGRFNVELRADAAPQHVGNFLEYARRGAYNDSFFHRSASLDPSGAISVVQGGGYFIAADGVDVIGTSEPVPLEYRLPNERGTLAAARTSDVNSATSQWYFNVTDNSAALGPENGGGYTVFGRVLGTGMTVVDAIAALPRVDAGGPFNELPVRNYTSGDVRVENLALVNSVTLLALYSDPITAGVLSFSAQTSNAGVVTAAVAGSTLTLTPVSGGEATITVEARDVNGNAAMTTFRVAVSNEQPAITMQPVSRTVAAGSTVVLSGAATAATRYQWRRNGEDLPGATDSALVIAGASTEDAGTYTLVASNALGSTASRDASVSVATVPASEVGRLVNLSIRAGAGTGAETLIVGFVLGGNGTTGETPLLIRGIGPWLAGQGLAGALLDPALTMYSGQTVVATNENWAGNTDVSAWGARVGAFPLASNLEAALAASPQRGAYTVQITGSGGTGIALAEIYEAATTFTAETPRLINVSARANVGTGANVPIAGFVIRGSTARTVLVRAAGPALAMLGVEGTLADPKLQLAIPGTGTVVAENDNWGGVPEVVAAANSLGAFPFVHGTSTDAALLVTLPPGDYTALVTGADGGTGVALVEVYEVP